MDTESIKKIINDKFNKIEDKINNLTSNDIIINNKEQIYGYTVSHLLEEIQRINKELPYAYISGFFDGEGYTGVTGGKEKSMGLKIAITNTNLEILIKIKKEFGGQIYPLKKYEQHYKDKWLWTTQDRNLVKIFLEKILPYSTVKKQQILYGLKFLELTLNIQNRKIGMSSEEQKIRQFFSDKLKEMKNIELSDNELNIFNEKIKNINKNKNQSTMNNY